MKHTLFFLWTALLFLRVTGERFYSDFGLSKNYEILLKEIGNCPQNEQGKRLIYFNNIRIRKIHRNKQVVSGNMVLNEGFHNGLWVRLNMASRSGGSWVDNFFYTKGGPFCTHANSLYPKTFRSYLKALNYDSCPVPAGNYTINDADIITDINFPVIPYNKYRVRLPIDKNSTRIGCIQMIVDVVAKKN